MARNDARQPAAWVSISEYARLWGVNRNTVAKWVKLEAIEHYRKGAIVRVKNQSPTDEHADGR